MYSTHTGDQDPTHDDHIMLLLIRDSPLPQTNTSLRLCCIQLGERYGPQGGCRNLSAQSTFHHWEDRRKIILNFTEHLTNNSE